MRIVPLLSRDTRNRVKRKMEEKSKKQKENQKALRMQAKEKEMKDFFPSFCLGRK